MVTVSVTEAKASLSRLLQRALSGEVIAIGRRGEPEVLLVAADRDPAPRPLGSWKTDEPFWMADDFDEPLPDVEASFEGRRRT